MRRAALFAYMLCALFGFCATAVAQEEDEPLEMTRGEWKLFIEQVLAERAQLEVESPGAIADSPGMDDALVGQGQAAFNAGCVSCHDAERSLQARKGFGAWLATVRRMAVKEGADIPSGDFEPIAAYLTSLNPAAAAGGMDLGAGGGAAAAPTVSAFATISPLWRGTSDDMLLENPDFFVDAWIGADWQPAGPVSARVVGCTSCHADANGSDGFSLELVDASATLDLMALICGCDDAKSDHDSPLDATIKAGRFIVPFGAFQAMSYPGVYRTVSNPLMFNMGRRVGPTGPLQPVLPAPFSDEGVTGHLGLRFNDCWNATLDVYAINGLQDPSPRIFNSSRSYSDNNREPTVGGRVTVGSKWMRVGGSLMTGNLAMDGAAAAPYKLAGADATVRIHDSLRLYFEYGIREGDAFAPGRHDYVYGVVGEIEAYFTERISFLVRYDTLEHRHTAFGESSLERITSGINTTLPGGSWIALNHEHWMFPTFDVDVLGIRWTATF